MWPTPTTQEIEHPQAELTENGRRKSKDGNSSHSLNLADSVKVWPTPRARDYKDGKKVPPSVGKTRSHTLATKVIEENQKVMWPTPTTKGYGHASEGQTLMLRKMVEEGVLTEIEAEQMMNGTTTKNGEMEFSNANCKRSSNATKARNNGKDR